MANLTVEEDGGGDYTTLDEACDNIGAGETITVQGEWDNEDTRNVIVSTNCNITATGSARVTTAGHAAGTPLHFRLYCDSSGSHCITVNDNPTTIDGIDVRQGSSTGASDEGIRSAATGTIIIKNCIISSEETNVDQDGIYIFLDQTLTVENCIIYDWTRAAIDIQQGNNNKTIVINVNSCSIHEDLSQAGADVGGISADLRGTGTTAINVHNTFIFTISTNGNDYNEYQSGSTTITWGISFSIDSDNSIAARDGGGSGNQASRTIASSDQGAGSFVIVDDLTGNISNLALQDLVNANNNAQDEHATASAEGLTIPATDIDGTSRPQNTNYDIGAFEIVSGGAAIFASISDTVGITDNINTQVGAIRIIADNVGISDTIITGVRAVRNIADNVGISDTITKIGTYIRTLADNLSITDTINTARNLKISMADNVGITDVITGSVFKLVTLADTVGITDVLSHVGTFIRNIPDTIGITDAITTIKTAARNIADTVGITDVITSEKFVLVSIADTVGITDTLSIIGTYIRSIIDGIGITDVLAKIGTYKRSIADTAGITDTLNASKGVVRNIADTVGITDVISAIVGKVASLADTIGITDVITYIKTTVVRGRVFISAIARSLRISGSTKSLRISGEDKSLKISGSGD